MHVSPHADGSAGAGRRTDALHSAVLDDAERAAALGEAALRLHAKVHLRALLELVLCVRPSSVKAPDVEKPS